MSVVQLKIRCYPISLLFSRKFLELSFQKLAQPKLLLYKPKEWEYKKEWIVINSNHKDVLNKCSESRMIRPNSIYYGVSYIGGKSQTTPQICCRKEFAKILNGNR